MNIPKELLVEAMEASDAASQTQAVMMGLQALIQKKRRQEMLALEGSNILEQTRIAAIRQRRR